MDDKLTKRLANVEEQGKQKFSDSNWKSAIDAIGRAVKSAGGLSEDQVRNMVAPDDAPANIYHAGKDALLQQLQHAQDGRTGDPALARELEDQYYEIRRHEREHKRR
jgi:hypothetical protein